MAEYIKVNLPLTEAEYRSGNGEGVWVLVDEDTKRDYDNDLYGVGYSGILANDSLYYPGLCCGEKIAFEMRGENRPVVDFPNFLSCRDRLTEAGKCALLARISAAYDAEQEGA